MGGELGAVDAGRRLGPVQLQGILGGYESHAGRFLGVLDVLVKYLEASLPIFRRTQTRPRPLLPLPSRAAREVDRIPELGGDKFGGVEVRADHSSARAGQLLRGGVELPQDVHVPVLMIEIGTNLVPAHVVDVEQSAIPERLLIEANLDEGVQVGLDQQPFWYGGLLYIYNMGRYQIRPNLDHEDRNVDILRQFDAAAQQLAGAGGGVISTYFHPTEFVTTEFWDAVNFSRGATRERQEWTRPRLRTPEDRERCFKVLHEYVEHAKKTPGVRFVTAQDALQLYRPQAPPRVDRAKLAAHLRRQITFLRTEAGDLSAAEILLQMLGLDWRMVDGPSSRGGATYDAETIPRALFDRARQDAISFVTAHHRLPSEIFVGARTLSLADFAATVAGEALSPGPVKVLRGQLEVERYFATDASQSFRLPIHPDGFAAPELLELARLQGWTLKPARLR